LSTKPNRTQTIANVVKTMGPISREALGVEIARLFQEPYDKRSQGKTTSLLTQLRWKNRVLENEEGIFVAPEEKA